MAGQSLLSPLGLCLNAPASPLPRPPCTDAGVWAIVSHRLVSASNAHVLQHLCDDDGMDVKSG